MSFKTLIVNELPHSITLTLNRLEQNNSLNTLMLQEINSVMDIADKNQACRAIVIKSQQGVFCTGMDLTEIAQINCDKDRHKIKAWTGLYMATLKRIAACSKVVIAQVDGKVVAGGMGLVAACDIALATESSEFKLSEALWGLLPAMIAPYLIRRMGFQKTYLLALTTKTITAKEAQACQLIDVIDVTPEEYLKDIFRRLDRVNEETVLELKSYFRKMWIITEEMEAAAIEKTTELLCQPKIQENIRNFIKSRPLS